MRCDSQDGPRVHPVGLGQVVGVAGVPVAAAVEQLVQDDQPADVLHPLAPRRTAAATRSSARPGCGAMSRSTRATSSTDEWPGSSNGRSMTNFHVPAGARKCSSVSQPASRTLPNTRSTSRTEPRHTSRCAVAAQHVRAPRSPTPNALDDQPLDQVAAASVVVLAAGALHDRLVVDVGQHAPRSAGCGRRSRPGSPAPASTTAAPWPAPSSPRRRAAATGSTRGSATPAGRRSAP